MKSLALAALVGVLHVHHAPSHDSDAPFADVLAAADQDGLDFVVMTDHADVSAPAPLPGVEHAGVRIAPSGRKVLVLVGAELATADGHLLALDVVRAVPALGRPGRDVIADVHAQGGFAVVPHPESHGGWHDWDAPFDGLEIQNTASDFRRLYGPLLPVRLVRFAFDREAVLRELWLRPEAELARWDALLAAGRRVPAFAGTDAHQNVSLLGWQLDPYAQQFRGARMVCPDAPLEAHAVWRLLREGACAVRWAFYEPRAAEAREVRFPSGRVELQLDGGARLLEVRNPPFEPPLYSPP
ncbi:MAG TPA: CehA/McbA family metallohydrolase [Myxococcota bacterium]|nr:CehA/McbA family metallohydrolase [Myxococcota bacterium]